jgi:spermidine/putrescine transport system substrate-binding protein
MRLHDLEVAMPPLAGDPFDARKVRPGPLRRRSFLKAMLAAGAAPAVAELLAACAGSTTPSGGISDVSGTAPKIPSPSNPVRWPLSQENPPIKSGLKPKAGSTLRIYNYADYLGPQVLKDFEQRYGVNVNVSTFNDQDEALTKIASGGLGLDLYFPSYDSIGKLVGANLVRPLNQDYIPNIRHVWPQFHDPWYDLGWRYTVPYSVYTTGIGWRTDMVEEDVAARSNPYDVFWDPRYAGNLAVLDDWHTMMSMVLLRNGIVDINSTRTSDIRLMRRQMTDMTRKTNPQVTITMYNDLPAGQYGLAQMWSGDVVNAQYYLPKDTSASVLRYWFPENGRGMVDNDLMVVLTQGSNPVAAHVFIDYMLDPKVAAKNFGYIGYQPPQNDLDPERLVADGFLPENLRTAAVLPHYFDVGDRLLQLPPDADQSWHQVWQEFKAGA